MTIEETLYSTLTNAAGVTALVSTRIYPLVARYNAATPYITYQVIATTAHNKLSGAPDSEKKLIQINCISNDYDNAKAIATAVKAALADAGYLMGGGEDYFPQTENYRVHIDFSLIG